jgi:hypothetical protein
MTRTRNESGRYSKGTDWYRQIEEDHIARIEAEWTAQAATDEAAYLAGRPNLTEAEWQATLPDDGEYDDADLVPWDRAA